MIDKIDKFDMLGMMIYQDRDVFFFFRVNNGFGTFGSAHQMEDQRFHMRRARTKKRIREIEQESELIRYGGRGYQVHGCLESMCRGYPDWYPSNRQMRVEEYVCE